MQVGERWAYRARRTEDPVEVEVLAIGERKPPRVKVAFVDDDFEGLIEWVPPARLKVEWDGRGEYFALERRWEALSSESVSDYEDFAVDEVFASVVPREIAVRNHLSTERNTVCVINPAALAKLLETDDSELLAAPDSIVDQRGTHYPWSVTRRIAMAAAAVHPRELMVQVRREEAKAQAEAAYGEIRNGGRGEEFSEAEHRAQWYEETLRPMYDLIRSWCGEEAASVSDELAQLRSEVSRLAEVVEMAIGKIRDAGDERAAWALHKMIYPEATKKNWRTTLEMKAEARRRMFEETSRRAWTTFGSEPTSGHQPTRFRRWSGYR